MTDSDAPLLLCTPDDDRITQANLTAFMREQGVASYGELYRWSVTCPNEYWTAAIQRLGISFDVSPACALPADADPASPNWLPDARFNIASNCLAGLDRTAILEFGPSGARALSLKELRAIACSVAAGLRQRGLGAGDSVAVFLPMDARSIAIYLGIVLAGGTVVSIADSFSADALLTRLQIAETQLVFTVDVVGRGDRWLPVFERLIECDGPPAVVLPNRDSPVAGLREEDLLWDDFLTTETEHCVHIADAEHPTNILFSSGTTGDPKAIVWDQTTPIKAAVDAHFHHDVHAGDVLAWPTSLGWMMGPWLIYAALLNGATVALYNGAPTEAGFLRFVRDAGVTMLGVVPALVRRWRETGVAEGIDLKSVQTLSSTGECSVPDDMRWLSQLANGAPIVEYCGGTEIGGGYLTGTVIEPNYASTFSTPALGSRLVILDEAGEESDAGEVFLLPPAMGLSRKLLNRENADVYHADLPPWPELLRRHGDLVRRTSRGYRVLGRADDTMNPGGIKVGSAEIERVLQDTPGVHELAAIEVRGDSGHSALVICAVADESAQPEVLRGEMQRRLSERLNPLFRITEVRLMSVLPRTASNKIMRRVLREGSR